MNPPVETSRLSRILSLPHTLCLSAAVIFFVAACACLTQGTGQATAAIDPNHETGISTPIEEAALHTALEDDVKQGRAALIYYKETTPLKEAQPTEPAPVERTAPEEKPRSPFVPDITRGDASLKEVALTFDGGSGKVGETYEILDVLRKRYIKATIFLTGQFIRENPEAVRRIVADGHEVGNHTLNHPHLTAFARDYRHTTLEGVNASVIRQELEGADDLFREVTGTEMAPLWRAPYGEINSNIRRWALEDGYVHIGWTSDYENRESLDTLDWVRDRSSRFYRTPEEIKARVMNFGKGRGGVGGGIILMHLNTGRGNDRAALMLGDMLDSLARRGYRFVKVSTLIEGNRLLREARNRRSAQMASANLSGIFHR